ncbi:unnamed protein product [Cylicocyclus nassatus]|uniref:Uncharacterized protein n=1 Tax=Cylicocyclus nassatus TaxID=53992 RepID=A0AA36M8X0_CYLNA|nr:unnamed protein product [Cylicocyclus nassatus]
MSRSLCLLLALISLADSFYLGNYYVGALPYRFMDSPYENRLALGQWRGGRDYTASDNALQKDKKDSLPMKRFKPCYYSPIQCLIKRR